MSSATQEIPFKIVIDGKQITPTMNELTKALKDAKKEQDKLVEGTKEFEAAGQKVRKLQDAVDNTTAATKKSREEGVKFNDELRKLGPAGNLIADVGDKFNNVKGNAASAGSAIKGASALALGGIGLVVAALTALVAWLKNTDSGAKLLEGTMNAVGNVLKVLTGVVISFGKTLFDAVTKPGEALAKLADALTHPIDTFNKLSNGAKDFANQLTEATKAGYELAEVMDLIDETQRSVNEANAEADKLITQLLISSKDRTKSEQERLALLDRASKLEEAKLQRSLDLQKEKIAAVDLEIAQAAKIAGKDEVSDDLLNKRSALIVEQTRLQQESLNLQEKVSNREKALIESENAEREKSAEKRRQYLEKQLADSISIENRITDAQISLISDSYEQQRQIKFAAYNKERDDLIAKNQLNNELEILNRQKLAEDIAAIDAKEAEDKRQKKVATINLETEEELLALEQRFFGLVGQEQALENEKRAIKKQALDEQLALIVGNSEKERAEKVKLKSEILKIESEQAKESLEIIRRQAALEKQLEAAKYEVARTFLQLGIELLGQNAEAKKKYGGLIKTLAVSQVAIDLYQQISTIWKNAAAAPGNELTYGALGTALGIAQTAIAVGRAGIAISNINAQQFAKGGIVKPMMLALGGGIAQGSRHGSSYGESGIAMVDRNSGREVGEMEGGEIVLTRNVALNPRLRAAASSINVMAGGRSFAEGGMPVPIDTPNSANFEEYLKLIAAQNEKIDSWARNLTVLNSIVDTQQKLDDYAKMVNNVNI